VAEKTRRQQIEEMLADDPADSFLRYGLAMEFLSAGEPDAAVGCLNELIALDAAYVPAYVQLGQAYQRQGKMADAARTFRTGIRVARDQGDTHASEEMAGFLAALESA
jgi:Tfp pilus assembly protein PilF